MRGDEKSRHEKPPRLKALESKKRALPAFAAAFRMVV